jgi:hypothetical protein
MRAPLVCPASTTTVASESPDITPLHGEAALRGWCVGQELRDHGTFARDTRLQANVLLGVSPAQARADHGKRTSTGRERGGVSAGIDACSETARDGVAAGDDVAGDALGAGHAAFRRPTSAHDRDRSAVLGA